uniref:Zinc finger protein 648 n=1 Tax=Taeniopygia guttata TaxID=59729 RepID=A0A674GRP1_TAEGU|nr:zinc finger protein 648 [Taeniopygia guttata]XP_012430847.4 zinc finger protein 648 [Taeniopygia guttata]XP_030135498.3 zinc finger protein 648 [Taeniopygia guttata]XP_030135500.3 zinc finger protein 648 [Taeniopygia guttata]XP_041573781.1 zinc finger protein 648 [Taeniopygia guttata]XP_041573782.1 zinc finger protein 648 [Taeniopygia guttata]
MQCLPHRMDASENNICDTGGEHSNYPRKATEQLGHSCRPQKEVGMNSSCSPPGKSAGPAGKKELPADKETCDTYCQKQGESPAGQFAPSCSSFHLQREEDLDHCSSEHPRTIAKLCEDDGSAALGDAFGEGAEPVPEEALPCRGKECGSSFRSVSQLQEHRRARPPESSYRCPICTKAFSRAANLRMHKLIHSSQRPHKCPECDKGFIRTADVWRHLRNVHKIERSMVILASGMARNPWSVVHHSQQHNAECPDQACPANPKSQEDDLKPYGCPTCGKGFDKPNLLSKHKVIHREDKPYKCQECGMAFVQLLRLKRHQQTHSGARPFYCEECGGTFTRLASLQRHHRIHTGEKPYCCNFCGHSFTESGTLRRHERTHKLDKP